MPLGVVLSVFGGLGLILVAMLIIFILWDRGFKNRVLIARQTGRSVDDFILIPDRFKVVLRGGAYIIQFRSIKPRAPSVEGSYWVKFAGKKAIKLTQQEWETRDMRKLIQRGLILYETTDGLFYPMKVQERAGELGFSIMDTDTRMFLADTIEKNHALTKRSIAEILAQIAIIAGIVIMIVGFIVGYIYINKVGQENIQLSAQVCSEYARSIINITQNGGNQYAGGIKLPTLPGG
jgi:hypothetical protein